MLKIQLVKAGNIPKEGLKNLKQKGEGRGDFASFLIHYLNFSGKGLEIQRGKGKELPPQQVLGGRAASYNRGRNLYTERSGKSKVNFLPKLLKGNSNFIVDSLPLRFIKPEVNNVTRLINFGKKIEFFKKANSPDRLPSIQREMPRVETEPKKVLFIKDTDKTKYEKSIYETLIKDRDQISQKEGVLKDSLIKSYSKNKTTDQVINGERGTDSSHNNQGIKDIGKEDITLIFTRYENNSHRVGLKPDYQMQKNADEIFNGFVKQFNFLISKGGGEANLVLKPDFLGNLRVKIKLDHNQVNANVFVETQSVKDLIVSRLNVLEQNLLQQGFSLGSFQVEVRDNNTGPKGTYEESKRLAVFGAKDLSEEDIFPDPGTLLSQGLPWLSTIINIMV